jgi:type 1 glutamine amidotransferase
MIGLGGWSKRNENAGPYRYIDNEGKIIIDGYPGPAGEHGTQHPFIVKTYSKNHPIMKGIPESWMHVSDILYGKLRGPGEAMTILATAYSDPKLNGTGRNEPVMMTIKFGSGRIFHTTLGHDTSAISCVGFMTTFVRGCEWAATGDVTFPVPENFPTVDSTSSIKY